MVDAHEQLDDGEHDALVSVLARIIRFAVRILAVMMTVVIVLGVIDVAWTLHQRAMAEPRYVLTISDILGVFGAFMAVLIAIEIFVNITVYLREHVIHVRIVVATALMAIARKVIILDYANVSADYVWATAAVVLAMSVAYWLVTATQAGSYPSTGVPAMRKDGVPVDAPTPAERAASRSTDGTETPAPSNQWSSRPGDPDGS